VPIGTALSRHIGTPSITINSRHRLSVNLQLQRTVACKFHDSFLPDLMPSLSGNCIGS
jgi:hypothetical protein